MQLDDPDLDRDGFAVRRAILDQAGIMRPLILHASSRALHPARRRVLHFEYAPLAALDPSLHWAEPTVA